jgi:Glycosyltransferase family 92
MALRKFAAVIVMGLAGVTFTNTLLSHFKEDLNGSNSALLSIDRKDESNPQFLLNLSMNGNVSLESHDTQATNSKNRSDTYQSLFRLEGSKNNNQRQRKMSLGLHETTSNISMTVLFRPFLRKSMHHNRTVEGKFLPGPFYHKKLFLLGLRLSTSYEQNNSEVHVDIFGYPGDFVGIKNNKFCDVHSDPNRWNLFEYDTFQSGNQTLFCQLECKRRKVVFKDCGEPIPAIFIPLRSGDGNQNYNSLIWRCNVTQYLDKSLILKHAALRDRPLSIRVKLFLRDNSMNQTKKLENISQIDIPLHTAVAGYGGAQIRPENLGFFSPNRTKQSIPVGMCLSIFESRAAMYIPEFLHHHRNVGIEHFMIGVDTKLDSPSLSHVEKALRPYIEEGLVVLQAFGLNDFFQCDTDVAKLQFYHQCLYHFKGLTKYVVTWDIDEYWIPPDRLEVSGENDFDIHREGVINATLADTSLASNESFQMKKKFINRSLLSSFPSSVMNDKLWKASNYSKSISFFDTIKAIEKFHKQHECAEKWCFHLFPSYTVGLKSLQGRKNLVSRDFLYREAKTNMVWKKGLVQTRFAMMNGFHLAGSCKFPNSPIYFNKAEDPKCYPVSWVNGEFGTIHHYLSLIKYRDDEDLLTKEKDGAKIDEYVSRYGATVVAQLEKYKRLSHPPK